MFERVVPLRDPVEIELDGRKVLAERGEPLAFALLAAGEAALARSPKLHRPRGPSCLRGDCDGCLARIDGVPNEMTCHRDAAGGERIGTQNVLGSRKTDLLRVTDWFFPEGIDHHHLLTSVPGASALVSTFARQLAGVGRLPEAPASPRAVDRATPDVLVVGGGLSGVCAASHLARAGLHVWLVDESHAIGGAARALGEPATTRLSAHPLEGVTLRSRATVAAIYGREALLVDRAGGTVVAPRAIVLATGAHDGALDVPGNDLPGVIAGRAVAWLAAHGILPKGGCVIVGSGAFAPRLAALLGDRVVASVSRDEVASIRGTSRARGVRLTNGRAVEAAVVATCLPTAPAFELATQAGAETRFTGDGYAVVTSDEGRAADGVWATGECVGLPLEIEALVAHAERTARDVIAALA